MSIVLTNSDNETDGGALELDGASAVASADVGGTTYVFVAGAVDNGISVFSLGLNGVLTSVADVTDSGALNLVGVSGLTTVVVDGNTYLVAAGAGDNGLSLFRVATNGALTPVHNVADGGSLHLGGVSRVASAVVSGAAFVFAAGASDDGISVFRVRGDGSLVAAFDLVDTGGIELDGVKGLTTAVVNGTTYLFAAGGVDDGVSVFSVSNAGVLTHTSSTTDAGALELDGASDVATAVVGGVTYLFVSGAVDNGVSVFSVSNGGVLTNVANVDDVAGLRLAGAQGLSVSVQGATTYLTVGGAENGVSIFKVNAGGSLTFVDNKDDGGSLELDGATTTTTATVGGTTYTIAAGATDDGVSVLGTEPTGQVWYLTQGGANDARLIYVNSDGLNHTTVFDNNPTVDLGTSVPEDVALDTAAGLFFVLSGGGDGSNSRILAGRIGSATPPTTVETYNATDDLVYAMHIDNINEKLYVSYIDVGAGFGNTTQGIKVYDYNTTTGALSNEQFLVTQATAGITNSGTGTGIFIPRDFDIDTQRGFLYFTNVSLGSSVETNMVWRLDLNNITAAAVKLAPQAQFPLDGNGTDFTTLNGIITDVEIDISANRAYFITHAEDTFDPDAENAIWMVANASTTNGAGNAVKVTVAGVTAANFYPGDMTLDEVNNVLYIETENVTDGDGSSDDDLIWVFQLDAAGTTATLINTITPGFGATGNIGGMHFNSLPTLSGLNGTATAANEQGANVTLLTGAPTITDVESDRLASATVQITGGKFLSNESSATDDHLGHGVGQQISGLVGSTNITLSWNAATSTLTLSGYDTLANYQAVMAGIRYWATGDNPTNYGLNTTRTVTWTVSDGSPDVPGGAQNSGTTTINITAVNDAPVNSAASATGAEDTAIAVTGLSISDPDANPGVTDITVTLSVTKGVLTFLTNVAGGVTAGDISGNGSTTVTLTATLNEINATLAATNGLVFTGAANVNGTDTLTVVTNDGGNTGSGGALSDTDLYTITIGAVNDAPIVAGDQTEVLAAANEDASNAALTNTVSALFAGQFDDSADQVSGGSSANSFAGVAVVANGSTAGTGQWQYHDGADWQNIGAVSVATAVTLAASTALRFLPAADFNGPAPTLTVKLIDSSGGALANHGTANVTTSGGSMPYSALTVDLSHTVTAINDAPVTIGGAAVALTTIGEDSAPGAGETVSALFASHFSDANDQVSGGSSANALAGVAVTSNTATPAQGVYQYFAGGVWQDLPAVSASSAFVLDASTLVRFVPAADFSGTPPSLLVYMIEDSAGAVTTGDTADLSTNGGSTPYGTVMVLGITVTPTNDAPVATGSATLTSVNEDTAAPVGQTVSTLFDAHFTDPDVGDTLAGVAIVGNAATSQGVWQYFNGAWFTIASPTESAALVLAASTLVRFLPAANFNGATPALTAYLIDSSGGAIGAPATLDVSVNGGQTRFSDTPIDLTTSITAVNDSPVVPPTATTVGATEQTAAVLLGSITVSDVDLGARNGGNGDYGGASFTVQRASANAVDTFAFASGGMFTVSGGNLQVGGLTFATFTSVGGVLTITFTSAATTATTALVNDLINHITYTNSSDAPSSSVTLDYVLNDGSPGGGQGAGGAASDNGAVIVNITAANDPHTGGASITGTAAEDQVLTAVSTLADPDGLGTLQYQWQRDDGGGFVDIATATASTYTLVEGDVGSMIQVIISYTDGGGTVESATSTSTLEVVASNDPHTGGVSITGTAAEDQVLTADTSTLADSDGLGAMSYQWQRSNGAGWDPVGSDQATYTLGDADVGKTVRVIVSYTDLQGFAESATSAATASVANVNDAPTGLVTITGTVAENQVLTADTSALADSDGLGALSYQWQRDAGAGFIDVGANQATYTLDDPDVGAAIRVVVSYTDARGTAEARTSAATVAVANGNDPLTGGVTISGTSTEDQVLTAVSTLADPDGLGALSYQWQRNTGSGFVNAGTDQATYTLGDADVGATIRVVVSYTDGGGFAESATSPPTAAIVNINDVPTGAVVITGTLAEDQVLTADTSTLADADGRGPLHYQWQRNGGSGFVNVGADQATYALGDTDVGATFRVVVSYTDLHATPESKTSAVTAAVVNVNDAPVGVNDVNAVIQRSTVTGTVRANDTDIDNAVTALTVTNVAFNFTHVDQAVVAGGTVVNGGFGKLTISPDGAYSYQASQEGLVIGQVATDRFDYVVTDPSGASATAQLTVTVTGSATGDANANIIISNSLDHTLTGKGGADALTGGGGADIFAYEAIGDSTTSAFDTITDFAHGQDALRLTPLMTGSTKLTLVTDGTNGFLYIDQNGDGAAEGLILANGLGLQVTDIVTGVANFGFSIYGSGGGDTLNGGAGNDVIAGYGGADTLRGAGGGDILYGGAGADTFVYGAGESTLAGWDLVADFATGQDKLNIAAADGGNVVIARFGNSSFVYFGSGPGSSVVQTIGAVQASDLIVSGATTGLTIYGSFGAETLIGGSGNDVLVGGSGTSNLIGGAGADILYGRLGAETFTYQSAAHSNFAAYDLIIGFTSGVDTVDISAIDGGGVTLARYDGVTFIYSALDLGGAAQSVIAVQGLSLKSTDLITSGGANQAFTLVGDGSSHNVADVLVAAGGDDILYGLDGDDTLTGGGGADFMIGGTGADTFVFNAVSESGAVASDQVFDFNASQGDKIDLRGIDAKTTVAGDDAFAVVATFSNVAGQLVLGAADALGYHHLSGDVNGDGVADFVLALKAVGAFAASDILL